MIRSRISSSLLTSAAVGLCVVALFRLLAQLDSHGLASHAARPETAMPSGWDRIGEAQLFVLMWSVCILLAMAAVLAALRRERASATGPEDEMTGPGVDRAAASWHDGGLQERG